LIKYTRFRFCPRCGSRNIGAFNRKGMNCGECGYLYFHNCASATMGIIEAARGIILVKRGSPPKRGYYDLPGGFVDYDESFEAALRREVKEELNIAVVDLRYLASFPNIYHYKKVTYFTTDAVFVCKPASVEGMHPEEEISGIAIIKPEKIEVETLAFESSRQALRKYLKN
jgi:NAD+ diphosphatase